VVEAHCDEGVGASEATSPAAISRGVRVRQQELNRLTRRPSTDPTPLAKTSAMMRSATCCRSRTSALQLTQPPGSPLRMRDRGQRRSISTPSPMIPNGKPDLGLGRTIGTAPTTSLRGITLVRASSVSGRHRPPALQAGDAGRRDTLYAHSACCRLSSPARGQRWTDYLSVGNAKVGMAG